jgi:hypothetical protein
MTDFYYSLKDQKRMWRKIRVVDGDGCWEWQGHVDQKGYGRFSFNTFEKRTCGNSHRSVYEMHVGRILPKNILVCHRCDNRKCCRPDHLFEGTAKDNMVDCSTKGRNSSSKKTHCSNGHLFDDKNTLVRIREGSKWRRCRACARQWKKESTARRKIRNA